MKLHWDGHRWSVAPGPRGDAEGLVTVGSGDLWALGRTEVEHWDGKAWRSVPTPPANAQEFTGIFGDHANDDLWLAGDSIVGAVNHIARQHILLEHWDGRKWSVVPCPSPGRFLSSVSSIVVVSPTDAWASGTYFVGSGPSAPERALIEHWDGDRWMVVPSPNPSRTLNVLWGSLGVVSANDVWAVGHDEIGGHERALIDHWDGTRWSVASPGVGGWNLDGVVVRPPRELWLYRTAEGGPGLIERRHGAVWSSVMLPFAALSGLQVINETLQAIAYPPGGAGEPLVFARWGGTGWSLGSIPNPLSG